MSSYNFVSAATSAISSLDSGMKAATNAIATLDIAGMKVPTSITNFNVDTMLGGQPRGLSNFIAEIRACATTQEEQVRVDAELGNIRGKFSDTSKLTSYQKKKYIWKMCYIHMLGYDVDFGHVEFISLMASQKYSEKSVGYLAISLMLKPGDELMTLVINSIRNDVVGQLDFGQSLGLSAVANIGGMELSEALSSDIQNMLFHPNDHIARGDPTKTNPELDARVRSGLLKKASMCILRLFRANPDILSVDKALADKMATVLGERDIGVLTSAMSLMLAFVAHSPGVFEPLIPIVVGLLSRLLINRTCGQDYLYYRIPAPWLQVKCFKFLQYFKLPDGVQLEHLSEILTKILLKNEQQNETSNKSNAENSILFEAINLVISYGADAPTFLKEKAADILGKFISVKDANTRYLGLEAMTRLAKIDGPGSVQSHQQVVIDSLKDADYSVKKKALNLLYVLSDITNAKEVVEELVLNLATADTIIKEDIVVKAAILSEKYCDGDFTWYVNTMVQVILVAGDFVSEEVWYRIVQIVTNATDIHEYAAEKLLKMTQSKWTHETLVCVSGYLLGEIGVNICEKPGMSGHDQFTALHQHFLQVSAKTQGILLTAYMKFLNLYPEQVRDEVNEVFTKHSMSSDLELQQRSCEYLVYPTISSDIMENVLNTMPAYEMSADDDSNKLVAIAQGLTADKTTTDRSVWSMGQSEKDASREAYKAGMEVTAEADVENEEGTLYPPEPPTKPSKPAAKFVDLLSMDDEPVEVANNTSFTASSFSSSSSSSSSSKIELPTESAADINAWFQAAAIARGVSKRSVLFEYRPTSPVPHPLLVSVAADYRSHMCRMALFFSNVAPNDHITNLSVAIPSLDYLTVTAQDLQSSSLTPGQETRMPIAMDCLRPFTSSPIATVSYSAGGRSYSYSLRLPVTAVSFLEPMTCDKDGYLARWKAMSAENLTAQQVFSSGKPIDSTMMTYIRTVLLPEGMKTGLVEGMDASEKTVTGIASFVTGTAMPNNPSTTVSVGALFRLEADFATGKFRVTVRAKHPDIAVALKTFIVEQLS